MSINGELIEKCEGCKKIVKNFCSVYFFPKTIWRLGVCPFRFSAVEDDTKIRVGQQKQVKSKKKKG